MRIGCLIGSLQVAGGSTRGRKRIRGAMALLGQGNTVNRRIHPHRSGILRPGHRYG